MKNIREETEKSETRLQWINRWEDEKLQRRGFNCNNAAAMSVFWKSGNERRN